ncbi:hypothetical protein [Caballeronia sp.]|uniref:hypothetical protein n=1 Tax=Caballeronia sp. TaxID=1931223 RepID=UPI003C6B8966
MSKKYHIQNVLLVVLTVPITYSYAFASGLDSATQGATTFKVWLYSFLGVCALMYLGWKGAESWMDRGHWSDFVTACGKVAVVGGVAVLAPWLWNMFVS